MTAEKFCPTVGEYTNLKVSKKTRELLQKRIDEREAVIDAVVNFLGIADNGRNHYGVYEATEQGTILHAIENLADNSGDKAKMKRRIKELEAALKVIKSI